MNINYKEFCESVFNTEVEKEKLLNLYYPYFISADLENMDLSNDDCFLLIDKYGYENIENYFTELLLQTKNPSYLKKKYEFFYNIIDDNGLSIDDKNEDFDVQYNDAFQLYLKDIGQYPLLSRNEEKRIFKLLSDLNVFGNRYLSLCDKARGKTPVFIFAEASVII